MLAKEKRKKIYQFQGNIRKLNILLKGGQPLSFNRVSFQIKQHIPHHQDYFGGFWTENMQHSESNLIPSQILRLHRRRLENLTIWFPPAEIQETFLENLIPTCSNTGDFVGILRRKLLKVRMGVTWSLHCCYWWTYPQPWKNIIKFWESFTTMKIYIVLHSV